MLAFINKLPKDHEDDTLCGVSFEEIQTMAGMKSEPKNGATKDIEEKATC